MGDEHGCGTPMLSARDALDIVCHTSTQNTYWPRPLKGTGQGLVGDWDLYPTM